MGIFYYSASKIFNQKMVKVNYPTLLSIIFIGMLFVCNCEATVPYRVCERCIRNSYNYSINTTVNPPNISVFNDAHHYITLLRRKKRFQKHCEKQTLSVKVVLQVDYGENCEKWNECIVTANYKITIGVNDEIKKNVSVLTNATGKAIDNCYDMIDNNVLSDDQYMRRNLVINVTGKTIEPYIDIIDAEISLQNCEDAIVYCPPLSLEINQTCECSQGTYLDANLTDCVHCPRDSYQNQIGMSHCLQCAIGFTTRNKTGRNSSTDCRRAPPSCMTFNCSENQHYNKTLKMCIDCPKNQYQDEHNCTKCKPCPKKNMILEIGACLVNKDDKDFSLVIALSITGVVILFVAVIIFVYLRRRKLKIEDRERQDQQSFVRNFIERTTSNSKLDEDIEKQSSRVKRISKNPYYEEEPILRDLADDITRKKMEILRDWITLTGKKLGRGNFGEVLQVILHKPNEEKTLCAAKMARGNRASEDDMIDELEIHLSLENAHENVVNLIGVCSSEDGPFYLLVEYCENGSLVEYLRQYDNNDITKNKDTLSKEWKLNCILQICCGMKYLAKHKIVHRDLAARNVLLDKDLVAKISDFGMAKDIYLKSYYREQKEGSFPLRWMAIESIRNLTFTESTDVWSFGILIWEIFTNGDIPYYKIIDDQKVALFILSGKKLSRPQNCPKFMYNIMLKCWKNESYNRPKFWDLYNQLNESILNKNSNNFRRRFSRDDIIRQLNKRTLSLRRKISRDDANERVASVRKVQSMKVKRNSVPQSNNFEQPNDHRRYKKGSIPVITGKINEEVSH
ncbi:muscle, skeletal receptor tyrosine protein kinase-like [Xenia sp. Carnegie-2017]|uniref:muscle, skeletal receptor tyrosine protein kinase-like n=1 Tax=Xenia sp. Carnegie-2017 TaxID=2897299 RepID=UPI001F036669|nr:muscle, skeletal receptor tyrosine protein kinase-like [Xenia sp. Carnegie-2017]